MVSKIQPRQGIIGEGHYGKVKGQIKVTPRCFTSTHPSQWPGQDFIGQGDYGKVKGQIKVTP